MANGESVLENFRKEWQKELQTQHTTERDLNLDPIKPSSTSSLAAVDNKSGSNNTINTTLKDPFLSVIGRSSVDLNLVDNHDDDSRDGIISNLGNQSKAPLYNYNESTESSEYYPFRILTQFLNEAPKKAYVPQRKKKSTDSTSSPRHSPAETFCKRKYFQSSAKSGLEQKSKVSKTDSATVAPPDTDSTTLKGSKRMLDLFLADLDEINEIPFFDSTLPREVAVKIFQYLDLKALCCCAQVSRSWKSLADDEHLWCAICHHLGYDIDTSVGDFCDWKTKVQQFVEEKHLLESNWKVRVGRPYNLSYAKGGVLCAVHSTESIIVAGFTNCSVKSWNTESGEECTFNASNTSMVIDESADDLCRIHNEIRHLRTSPQITAASFRHGFVDVWVNDFGTDPVHTLTFNSSDVSSLCVRDVCRGQSVVAASQGTRVHVVNVNEESGGVVADFNMKDIVKDLQWLQGNNSLSHSSCNESHLLISTSETVWLKEFDPCSTSSPSVISTQNEMNLQEIHSVYMSPVTCTTVRPKSSQVGVGFNMTTGPSIEIKVNVYDVDVGKLRNSLRGHTWLISAIHMPQGLSNQLVTGSGDRKVRLFDAQAQTAPVMTLAGHSAKVTCVQMDEIKVVSADEAGFVCMWDQRMGRKLWDLHNRHPVQYCHFDGRLLIIGNVPYQKFPVYDEFESATSLRYRGTVQCYDFLANQQRPGIPEICLSSYNEPEASVSNLGLAVPYDSY